MSKIHISHLTTHLHKQANSIDYLKNPEGIVLDCKRPENLHNILQKESGPNYTAKKQKRQLEIEQQWTLSDFTEFEVFSENTLV